MLPTTNYFADYLKSQIKCEFGSLYALSEAWEELIGGRCPTSTIGDWQNGKRDPQVLGLHILSVFAEKYNTSTGKHFMWNVAQNRPFTGGEMADAIVGRFDPAEIENNSIQIQ